jgi:minor histocompatibility antigen H13
MFSIELTVSHSPFMITVATKLDVPIKLVFQNEAGHASILGLGDIVLPGIFIALALRFDLWRYYNNQIKLVPTELVTELTADTTGDESSEPSATLTKTQHRAVKQPYVSPKEQWGNRLWTQGLTGLFSSPTATPGLVVSAFPKTYFYMAMLGYFVGMLLTMTVLVIFKHGQPALLYLVPCVTGAVWLTGAVRGELDLLWKYTEDGTLDTQDVIVEMDGQGNVIKEISSKTAEEAEKEKENVEAVVDKKEAKKSKAKRDDGYPVFLLSLVAPRQQDPKEE